MVDNFSCACKNEDTAKMIYNIIGKPMHFSKEDKPLFTYLGLIKDFNGIDIEQANNHVQISCKNYINWLCISHGWKTLPNNLPSHPTAPIPEDSIQLIYKDTGLTEGTKEAAILEEKAGFNYCTLLGEMMYCYVTCHPNIGYFIITMSLQIFKTDCKIPA